MKWNDDDSPQTSGPPEPQTFPSLADWFRVGFDDTVINIRVNPPERPAWESRVEWARIIRVCFKAGDLFTTDEIYLFTDERPESYLIPTEAGGGAALWDEIIRRGVFDAELAIEAASATDRLFCWPLAEQQP